MNQVYLGVSGVVSLDPVKAETNNKLLNYLGVEGMLSQFERLIDDGDLADLINQIDENLYSNGIDMNQILQSK